MIANPFTASLAEAVSKFSEPEAVIGARLRNIHDEVLRRSAQIRQANFTSIHVRDLECLFRAYDGGFFGHHCQAALAGSRIQFRLSKRMTSTGGITTRFLSTDRRGEL